MLPSRFSAPHHAAGEVLSVSADARSATRALQEDAETSVQHGRELHTADHRHQRTAAGARRYKHAVYTTVFTLRRHALIRFCLFTFTYTTALKHAVYTAVFTLGLHDISFQHRYRDVRIRNSHIAGCAMFSRPILFVIY